MLQDYFRFGPYELSTAERVLRRDSVLVAIPPKALAVLQVLLEAGGRVVTKGELIEAVWPNSFVEEASLPQTISILRKLLAEVYPDESPIATIPRVGYFFRGAIEQGARPEEVQEPQQVVAAPEYVEEAPQGADEVVVAPPAKPVVRRSRWLWPALAGAGVVIAATVWLVGSRWNAPAKQEAAEFKQYTHNDAENWIRNASMSPDGTLVAYADSDGVLLQVIKSGAIHALQSPPSNNITQLEWYSDGLHLLASAADSVSNKQQLWRLSIIGSEPPVLLREDAQRGVPSPDGAHIAFTSAKDTEIWVGGPSAESPKLVRRGDAEDTFPVVVWTRDSQRLLLRKWGLRPPGTPQLPDEDKAELLHSSSYLAIDASTGAETAPSRPFPFESACLVKDNRLLFARINQETGSSRVWGVDIDPHTGALAGTPTVLKDPKAGVMWWISCSTDGSHMSVVVKTGAPDVYVGDFNAAAKTLDHVKRLTHDSKIDYQHAWTADSSTVIFESNRTGTFQIYRQRLDRHDAEIIAPSNLTQVFPQLTPDGKWILFESNGSPGMGGTYKLYRVPAQGAGTPVEVSGDVVEQYRCATRGTLCVVRKDEGKEKIVFYALDPIAGQGARLGSIPWVDGIWGGWDISPDGATIAVPSESAGKPEVLLLSTRQGSAARPTVLSVKLDRQISAIHWAADGKGWFVASRGPYTTRLFYVDAAGNASFLHETTGATWANPSPDGKKVAFPDITFDSNVWIQ